MSALPQQHVSNNPFATVAGWAITVALIGAVVYFAIVRPVMLFQNGIYAGFQYGDGRYAAVDAFATRYGLDLARQIRMGKPDVLNTHTPDYAIAGSGQVRVFHFIGPRGVKYCVSVWGGVKDKSHSTVVKGCKF